MAKLSSAIVQRKLATLRDVEEALARQVLYGGDLATNLLEQAPGMDERALTALLAETQELSPAPWGQLPRANGEVLALLPGDVALKNAVYPMEKAAGKLYVAVSERMKPEVEQDLAFSLGLGIVQRVAPLVRIKEAVCRDYALPLDRRSHRVLAKLEGKPDPSPSLVPAPLVGATDIASLPRPPSIPPLGLPAPTDMTPLYGAGSLNSAIPALRPLPQVTIRQPDPMTPPPAARAGVSIHERLTSPAPPEATGTGLAPTPTLRAEPGATASTLRIAPEAPLPHIGGERRNSSPPPPVVPERARASSPPPAGRGSSPPGARHDSQAPPSRRASQGRHSVARPDLSVWSAENKQAERRQRSRHRGPYTAADAEEDLLNADSRDEVLTSLFDFACQYFEYSALFAVHGDLAEGRSSHGPGADHAKITGIGVALDMPGALATARKEGHFGLQSLAKDGLDAQLARDLERNHGKKVLLLPILVRGRCVLIFYGDDGQDDVDLSVIGDVLAFAPLVASALENVIRKKKASLRQGAGLPPSTSLGPLPPRSRQTAPLPSREERREALAGALETTLRRASSRPPRSSRPPPMPMRNRSTPPGSPQSIRAAQASTVATNSATDTTDPSVTDAALAETTLIDPEVETPRSLPASRNEAQSDEGSDDRATPLPDEGALLPANEVAAEARAAQGPAAAGEAPETRGAVSVVPPQPVELLRAPTPAQGTPLLGSVPPPPAPPAPGSEYQRQEPVIEEPEDLTAELIDGSLPPEDDAPEISVGAAEVEWPPELGAMPGASPAGPPKLPSSQIVVAPTRPHRAHSSAEIRLPSIIVNVDHDIEGLVARLLDGDEKVLDRLAALGATAASYLVSRFPGPIREPDRLGTPEPASMRGPILRALARIGLPAAPFLSVRSNDRDATVRAWATSLLGEIPSVESATAISRRVTDASAEVRRAALDAGKLLQVDEDSRTALRDKVLSIAEGTASVESRSAAIEALAHFRDGRATPRLVRLLANRDEVGQSAEWALGVLTRQAFGRDTAAWEAWWKEKGGQHHIEWLIDSLMHEDAEIRRAAGEELKTLTKEYFGYYDDLPKAERAKSQKRYREWWQSTGKTKFSR